MSSASNPAVWVTLVCWLALAGVPAAGVGSGVAAARFRIFGSPAEGFPAIPVAARLVVVFHPELQGCHPEEAAVLRVLEDLAREPDVFVLAALPDSVQRPANRYGEPLPEVIWYLPTEVWVKEESIAPRPRIEVWSPEGRLVMLRGIAPAFSPEELVEEIRWARVFVAPRLGGP